MKKSKIALVLVVLFTMTFCSKDDTSVASKPSIIGKWKMESTSKPTNYDACDYESWIQFKTDTTLELYDACSMESSMATWSLNNNTLTITNAGSPLSIPVKVISLTTDTLIIEIPDFGDGVEVITNKRI
jgi:hypothetical protein